MDIDKQVPLAPRNVGGGRAHEELDRMEVGDSVLYSADVKARIAASANYRRLRYGKKFARRTQPDGSVRVWRVA